MGGGKTTLVRALAQRLPGTATVHFDHYETLTEHPIDDLRRWMEAGADLGEFVIPHLAEHLARLRSGLPVVDPSTGQTIAAGPQILFETPFARQHEATGKSIDLSIWIDTPLDIALARNLRDFTARPELYDDFRPWLSGYLDNYLSTVRDLLTMQREVVGAAADLRLDGRATVETNVDRAELAIREHESSKP